ETPHALILLAGLLILHITGLIDDRRPLGPGPKLAVMLIVATAVVFPTDSRPLTLLDAHAGGKWESISLTVLSLIVLTNAFTFLSIRITYQTAPLYESDVFVTQSLRRFVTLHKVLLTPLVILAIPLYDFASVTLIRLSQGKSPFVGDLQHFSHRLVKHGLSR